MICIYSTDNTNYSNNGDAVLLPISCTLTMTINGAWQLDLEHPYDAEERYKLIQEGAVIRADIKCVGEQSTIRQRFRIYTYNRGVNSVTCIAFPIAMEATFDAPIDNLVLENKTASEAVAQLQALNQKYSIETNVTGTKSTSFSNSNINSALASGDDGCFIQVWGGEVVYDNLKFNIRSRIGSDTGYKIQYGHNMTGIDYSKDDSGLSTRVHPISEDGIRLNGTGYVDSPLIDNYPIHHDRYMITPYRLVDTEEASPSRTAQETRACVSAVTTATTTLSQSSYATALGAGYQPDYIKTINADIITAVQNMTLANVISADLYKLLSDTIKNAMAWLAELTQPEWGWMGSDQTGWRYGDTNGYAKDMYVRIGKTWSYFGSQGYWEEPKDDKEEWDWHQKEGEGRRYGNFNKYFAHNTFVYITMEGTLQEYWFNEEGWYEADESGESEWSWHGSGTSEDPYWFGEEGATSEDPKKYAHDTWLFIDGAYYFFDRYGYYAPNTAILDYQWDWVQDDERWWFGNAIDREFAAVYVESQWLKINGTWYYFDEDGYVVDQDSSRSDAIAVFTTGMASLLTTVNTRKDALYTLLYALMTEWVNKKYAEGIDKPALTVTVSMADLSRTTEYANFAALETIKLGDSVEIDDTEHGIHTTGSRVIGLTYDVIRGYNSNVVIGKPQATVSSMLSQANGQAVAGGFDTSAIEAQIDALQDRVSDVRYNGRSLLQGTIAILDSIGGTSINYGTSTPTGGSDGDVYFQTDSNGNIVKIWQNHSGVWGYLSGGGLEYWTETDSQIYMQYEGDGMSVDTDGYIFTDAEWFNYCRAHAYYGTFYFKKANSAPAIIAVGGASTALYFYLVSTDPQGVKWLYREIHQSTEYIEPINGGSNTGTSRGCVEGSFTYNGTTWYYSEGKFNDEQGDTHDHPFKTISGYTYSHDAEYWSMKLLEQLSAKPTTTYKVGIGKSGNMLFFERAGTTLYSVTDEGVFNGSDFKVEETSLLTLIDAKQDALIAGQNITIGADGKTISATDTNTDALADLTDVEFSNLTNGQVLKYDSTNQKWFNSTGGGGGSEVIPNPQGTATDTLNTVEIDGTIFDLPNGGGGGGSGYSETTLWENLSGQSFKPNASATVNLTDDISNYDGLYIIWSATNNISNYPAFNYIPVSQIDMTGTIPFWNNAPRHNNVQACPCARVASSNQIQLEGATSNLNYYAFRIVGVKYGGGGSSEVNYSTEEQRIGTWIDGKPLYQKTVTIQNNVAWSNNTTFNNTISDADTIWIYDGYIYDGRSGANIIQPNPIIQTTDRGGFTIDISNKEKFKFISSATFSANSSRYAVLTVRYTKTTD